MKLKRSTPLERAMSPTLRGGSKRSPTRYVTKRSFNQAIRAARGNPDAASSIADHYRGLREQGITHVDTGYTVPDRVMPDMHRVLTEMDTAVEKIEGAGREPKGRRKLFSGAGREVRIPDSA